MTTTYVREMNPKQKNKPAKEGTECNVGPHRFPEVSRKETSHGLDLTRYHGRGYMGLANLGNTCFMNTCLQVLNHVYELNELFLVQRLHTKHKHRKETEPEHHMLNEWTELQEILWENEGAVSPNKFVHYVHHLAQIKHKELFTGWAQNDMPEFLLFFIESMHTTLSRRVVLNIYGKSETSVDTMAVVCYEMLRSVYEKEYSEVMELFYGIYVSEIRSSVTQKVYSQKPEMYFIVDIPIPPAMNRGGRPVDIYQCFDLFTQGETLDGDNAWYNETTKEKESVDKQLRFWNFPNILVVSLKRFSSIGHNKRQDLVTFPLEGLNLSKYVCGYDAKQYVYDLMGICNHTGGVMGGHYTAFVKNSDNVWVHYNDVVCEKVDNLEKLVSPMAYCLFYRKQTKKHT